ncbi:MAG: Na/Pi symporter, partial [Pseudomonadota bacterium]
MSATVTEPEARSSSSNWIQWLLVIGLVYLLLVAVAMIGTGFKAAAGDQAKELFAFASNPVTGVIVGTIATALIQSSSTVTSIIVGLVAGGLPVSIAIPMIMGANMGTTITNTIVSLGHVRQGEEFRRAFAAATVHDFFNLFSILIFLPLEIMFGFLQRTGEFLAGLMIGGDSMSMKGFNFIKPLVKPPVNTLKDLFHGIGASDLIMGIAFIVLGIALIFVVITYIGKL